MNRRWADMKIRRIRTRARLVVAVLVITATGLTAIEASLAGNPQNRPAVVRIAASAGWVDTGVDATPNDAYPIGAAGAVLTARTSLAGLPGPGRAAESGPAGQIRTCYQGCFLDGVGFGALVGKIGPSGTPFYVGAGPGFSIPGAAAQGGRLYLAVNDNTTPTSPAEDRGGYTVTIGTPVSGVTVPVYGSVPQNLIVNGNAEAGPGGDDTTVAAAPGWTTTGNFTVVDYALGEAFFGPGQILGPTSPGPPDRGANFFSGGPPDSPISTASQTIDLTPYQGLLSAGAGFTLSGWLGGFDVQDDNAALTATFKDGTGAILGTTTIGPVLGADRGGTTSLVCRAAGGAVPAGARSVVVELVMTRAAGAYNDGYADDLSLVLTP